MFSKDIYVTRRKNLCNKFDGGFGLFLGNDFCGMNYKDNVYPFRQDSTFLYYFGICQHNLAALIDFATGEAYLAGDSASVMDIVFSGPQPKLSDLAQKVGIPHALSWSGLQKKINESLKNKEKIHYLPQYRGENTLKLKTLLNIHSSELVPSVAMVEAIVDQRIIKTDEEIDQMRQAIALSHESHLMTMQLTQPGMYERDIVAKMREFATINQTDYAYPIIFTVHGEILHNNEYDHCMQAGQLLLNDSGLNSPYFYASDITRTFPVNGKFTSKQSEIYELVAQMQQCVFAKIKPGVVYQQCHLAAARCAVEGLIQLGLMRGDVDKAVKDGAYGLFFPHGLGHQIGLDVHDMEGLGEDHVGYSKELPRPEQFGLSALRFAKPLKKGMIITVEPGLYFIPALIDLWKSENKCAEYINFDAINAYRDFGGIRIEDNVLITENGYDNLSASIPSDLNDIEDACQ